MSKKASRPSWDEYFMNIAALVSGRSTCIRRHVGAVLVRDKRIITTGYNGVPAKIKHCLDVGCLRDEQGVPSGERHELCRGLHAEQNAIIQAAISGVSVEGATVYCTNMPCSICSKMLINIGASAILYKEGYSDPLSSDLLTEAGIPFQQID
ncbi:MAG: cytidine/deoxycytidylate deaminase family protein [Desulfobulbaceae bacterium]|nr:cytidine/deoxycytidylate deaminase family protein [Desulfobulbaceae bacterium]MCK5404913.1 cytidine/deoxycytidylate deaminase family protein [Desulfobulbaceae bacterium]